MARSIEELERLLAKYEENGPAKLFYSLRRKSWEAADLMNKIDMANIDLDSKDSKTFDRLQKVLADATKIAESCRILEGIAGITGNEEGDVKKRKAITPQTVAKGEVY